MFSTGIPNVKNTFCDTRARARHSVTPSVRWLLLQADRRLSKSFLCIYCMAAFQGDSGAIKQPWLSHRCQSKECNRKDTSAIKEMAQQNTFSQKTRTLLFFFNSSFVILNYWTNAFLIVWTKRYFSVLHTKTIWPGREERLHAGLSLWIIALITLAV